MSDMAIVGIGIDTVEILRVAAAARRGRFVERIFTADERAYFAGRGWNSSVVAGNFAAKEAVLKALGLGLAGAEMTDIEILRKDTGAPYVIVHGRAEKRLHELGGSRIWITISHDRWRAVAQAVAEGD